MQRQGQKGPPNDKALPGGEMDVWPLGVAKTSPRKNVVISIIRQAVIDDTQSCK